MAKNKTEKTAQRDPIKVVILNTDDDGVSLVHWVEDDSPHRVCLKLPDGTRIRGENAALVDPGSLEEAERFGVNWDELVATAAENVSLKDRPISDALNAAGIWTLEDFMNHSRQATEALGSVQNPLFTEVRREVRRRLDEQTENETEE